MSEPETPALGELFATDPLLLTKEDRAPIIAYYRERRALFIAGVKVAKAKPTKAPKSGPLPDIDLDLGDL